MARITITLPDELHRALKETAARRGRTIGSVVAESLTLYGIKTVESARSLVQRARAESQMADEEALKLAVQETRRQRRP